MLFFNFISASVYLVNFLICLWSWSLCVRFHDSRISYYPSPDGTWKRCWVLSVGGWLCTCLLLQRAHTSEEFLRSLERQFRLSAVSPSFTESITGQPYINYPNFVIGFQRDLGIVKKNFYQIYTIQPSRVCYTQTPSLLLITLEWESEAD